MEKLKEYRLKKGLTQLEMAKKLGTPIVTYRSWEYGAQTPRPEMREKIELLLQGEGDNE